MAGNNDLRIKITGSLNVGATIGEINSALKGIEKKINKLKLNVQIDDKISKTLADFSKAMQNHKEIAKDLNKVLREEETILKKADGTTEKLTRTYLKSGEIIEKTRKITDERTKSIKKEEEATGDLIDEIERLGKLQKDIQRFDAKGNLKGGTEKYRDGFTDTTYNYNKDGKLTSSKTVENLDQQENAAKQFKQSVENVRQSLVKVYDQGKVNEKFFNNFNKVINSAKNVQEIEKVEKALNRVNNQATNKALQQKLINDAETLLRTHRKTVDVAGTSDLINSLKQIKPNAQNASNQLQSLQVQLKGYSNGAKEAARQSMTLGTMLKTAMTKFPVWMISATLFYAPIRAMQDMVQRLIEIDTLMTDINRVMDVPDFKLTELLNEAVQVSDELSSKLTDVLKIIGDFGRMGFQESELIDISKTAQVLQNISDLDAKSSVDTLTSAMLNFNIAASDSVKIADQLNEVDNNFAISTKDLSDGLRKSASTAKTFGVEMEELVGYIAAIGSTTRESGAIIGNGLKTIFSRLTTMNDAKDALASVNVSIHDIGGNVKPVSDILGELASKWTTLTDEQRQNLGVSLAGRYQLSRFLALMNNWQLSVDATNTALNSQGSSMREQAKYADSLEGRINRLDTAWNKLTISTGNAFLTDGIIATVETLNDLATVTSTIVDKIGVLSGIFGVFGASLVLASTRVRTFTTALMFGTAGMTQTQLATSGLTAGMTRLGVATIGVRAALTGLAASTGVGLAFVVVGFAIEKLIKLYSEAKQKQQEFEESQRKNIDALTVNKKQTDNLIDSYKEMSKQRESGKWDVENEKEFLKIQQQLGEIYPSLISSIDATGQYHIKTTDAIDKEIKSTQELLKLKRDEIKLNAHKTFEDNVDKRDGMFGLENRVKRQRDQVEELRKVGADPSLVNKEEQELFRLETELSTMSQKVTDEVLKVSEAYQKLEIDPSVSRSVQSFVSSLDLSKLNPTELESYAINVAKITDEMQRAYERNDTNAFEKAKESLISYAQQYGATDVQAKSFDVTLEKVKTRSDLLANATYNGSEGVDALGESMEGVSDEVDSVVKSYEDAISSIEDLNSVMNDLNDTHSVSSDSINFLMEKYPHLLQYLGDEKTLRQKLSEEIEKESLIAKQSLVDKLKYNEQYYTNVIKNSAEAVKAFNEHYGIDLKQFKTLAQAKQEVDNRLRKSLGEAWNDFYKDYSKSASGMKVPMGELKAEFESVPKTYWQDIAVKEAQAAFNDISLSGITSAVSKAISSSGLDDPKKDKKSDKKSSKSDKPPLEYVSSDYEKNLNKYNLQLDKSKAKLETLSDTSAEYRKELTHQQTIIKNLAKTSTDEINRLGEKNKKLNSLLDGMGDYKKLTNNDDKELYNKRKKEYDDNEKTIQSLIKTNLDYSQSVTDINKSIKESKIKEATEAQEKSLKKVEEALKSYQDQLDKLDYSLSRSKSIQSLYEEGSSEWQTELAYQNKLLQDKIDLVQLERDSLQKSIRTEKLSADKKEELSKKIDELSLSYWDLKNAIKSNEDALLSYKESVADDVIDAVKKSYEMQRDIALAAIDDEMDALEKAHQKKLSLLDKEESARDHTKEMSKLNKERLQLQSKINVLALDNSQEAKAKRLELEKQLADLIEQIEEKQHDRSIDLQKESIDEAYNLQKDALNDKRKATERNFTELLNDERKYATMREQIIAGNLDNVQGLLGGFLSDFQSANDKTITEIGLSWQTLLNVIDAVKQAQSGLGSIPSTGDNVGTPTSGNPNSPSSSTGGRGRIVTGTFKNGLDASNLVDILQMQYGAENAKLSEDNGLYRVLADFSTLKRAEDVLNRLKERKLIGTGRIESFHEGGIVGGKGSRLAELANKLFNLNSGEQMIKSLNGELQIPPKNIPNIFKVMGNIMTSLAPQPSTSGGMGLEKLVHIENFYGTQKEVDNLSNTLVNKLKNKGIL